MDDAWNRAIELLGDGRVLSVIRALVMLVIGVVLARLAGRAVAVMVAKRGQPQQVLLARRGVFYAILAVAVFSALNQLGFDLAVFLGAAGVLTVALGFASQTSASNVISGLFLIGERHFVLGDVISVGQTQGEVLSIDLLSVKIRTFDNLYVRVPNETMVKTEIVNLTHFPIRRLDLMVPVSYRAEIGRVREVLATVAERNPLCLEEPKPMYLFQGMGESSITLQFSVWAARDRYFELKSCLAQEVVEAFARDGIEIPYPRRVLEQSEDAAAGNLARPPRNA